MNGLTSLWRSFPSDRLVSEDLLGKFFKHTHYGDEDTYPLDCVAGRNFFLAPHPDYIVLFKAVGKTPLGQATIWGEIAHLPTTASPFDDTEPFVSGEMYHYKSVRVQNNQVSYESRIAHHAYDGYVAECLDDATVLDWSSSSWTTLRNGGGSGCGSSPTEIGTGQFTNATTQDSWTYLQRTIIAFDTAGLPDTAIITSGFVGFFGYWKSNPQFNRLTLNAANGGEDGTILPWYVRKSSETVTSDTAQYWQGSRSIKVVTPSTYTYEGIECDTYSIGDIAPSNNYTFSIYLRGSGTVQLELAEYDTNRNWVAATGSSTITLTTSWVRYSVTHSFGSTGVHAAILVQTATQQAATFWADGAQLECGSSPTTFSLPGSNPTLDLSTVDSTPSVPVVAGDYNNTTFTRMADDISYANFTDWEWNFADLTTYGKLHILKTAPTSLMLLSAAEADNTPTTWVPGAGLLISGRGLYPLSYGDKPEAELPPYIAVWYNKQYSFTKQMAYEIGTGTTSYSFTKGLSYAIKKSTTFTKGMAYAVKTSTTFTKGMSYAIKRSVTFTKGLAYAINKSYTLTKGMAYAITWQKPTFTKGLAYAIKTSTSFTKGLAYSIKTSTSFTKGLSYSIKASYSIQKGMSYSVKASYSFTKGMAYAIAGGVTPRTFTLGMAYAVKASYSFTKSMSYAIKWQTVSFTKGMAYAIKSSTAFTKGLSYAINKSYTITKGMSYAVKTSTSFTKGLSYAIKTSTSFNKGLSYSIKKSYTLTKGMAYMIGGSHTFTKGLAYVIGTTTTFTKSLAYRIVGEVPEESVCVHVTCELNNIVTIECDLNPSVTIDCPTDDKEVTLECYLRCG